MASLGAPVVVRPDHARSATWTGIECAERGLASPVRRPTWLRQPLKRLLFPRLQSMHRVWRLEISVVPPRETGTM